MSTMQAAYEDLRADAARWDDMSSALGGAARSADGLALDSTVFPRVIDVDTHTPYSEVQEKVNTVLVSGQDETTKAADALLQIRADYQSTDESQAEEYRNQWEVVGA